MEASRRLLCRHHLTNMACLSETPPPSISKSSNIEPPRTLGLVT